MRPSVTSADGLADEFLPLLGLDTDKSLWQQYIDYWVLLFQGDLGVSLLKRVVQYDNSGGAGNYLPPLLFSYSSFDLTAAQVRDYVASGEPMGKAGAYAVQGAAASRIRPAM